MIPFRYAAVGIGASSCFEAAAIVLGLDGEPDGETDASCVASAAFTPAAFADAAAPETMERISEAGFASLSADVEELPAAVPGAIANNRATIQLEPATPGKANKVIAFAPHCNQLSSLAARASLEHHVRHQES